jgi:hypothetical protein
MRLNKKLQKEILGIKHILMKLLGVLHIIVAKLNMINQLHHTARLNEKVKCRSQRLM